MNFNLGLRAMDSFQENQRYADKGSVHGYVKERGTAASPRESYTAEGRWALLSLLGAAECPYALTLRAELVGFM